MGRLVEEIDDLDQRIKERSQEYRKTHLEFALAWNEQKRRERIAKNAKRKNELINKK